MKCLLFTVFTLVLICDCPVEVVSWFKGTESAGRTETPSIRYTVRRELGQTATEKHYALSPPWGNWFLDVDMDPPRFVRGEVRTLQWTPIAQLKVIDDKIHVIMLAGSQPNYNLRTYRLPSNGSGLLLAPKDKLYRVFNWGLFPDDRPDVMEFRDIIDLIGIPLSDRERYTISIQSSTTVPPVYRGQYTMFPFHVIPVYTTIVHVPSFLGAAQMDPVQMYQAEAGSTVNITSFSGLGLNTDLGIWLTGNIKVIYPMAFDRHIGDLGTNTLYYGTPLITTWISTTETPHILESVGREVVFKDINPLLSNAP